MRRSTLQFVAVLALGGLPACTVVAQSGRSQAFDVTGVRLDITPRIPAGRLEVRAVLTVDNPARVSDFEFLLADWYDHVAVAARSGAAAVSRPGNGTLRVHVARPANPEELTFTLAGTPRSTSENRPVLTDSSVFLLWSDRFYPAVLDDWAQFRAAITLPDGFRVLGPGVMPERATSPCGPCTWTLRASQPIRVASIIADTRWIETVTRANGLLMRTLLYPSAQRFADSIASTSADVIARYEELFGPYDFDAFTFATVDGIYARRAIAGGVIYEPSYLRQEMDSVGHDAHETALLWWGFTAAGTGPGSFQWTEGFGDYAEVLYNEARGQPIPRDFVLYRRGYLQMAGTDDEPTFTNPRSGPVWGNYVHGRLPFLMHVMRFAIGDSAFRRGLRLLFERYRFRVYTIDQLVATMGEAAGQSLAWWKHEWVDRNGVPTLRWTADVQPEGDGFRLTVTVDQVGAVYHLPLEIRLRTRTGERLRRVSLEHAHQSFVFRTDAADPEVTLDPHHWLLARITQPEAQRVPVIDGVRHP